MAVQIIQRLLSDLSGEEAQQTVQFGLDGREYLIDLTEQENEELREFLSRYVAKGAKFVNGQPPLGRNGVYTPKRAGSTPRVYGDGNAPDPYLAPQGERAAYLALVRTWAHEKGIFVNNRGRVPQTVMDLYANRHNLEAAAIRMVAEEANLKYRKDTMDVVSGRVPLKDNEGDIIQVPRGHQVEQDEPAAKKAIKSAPAPLFSDPEPEPEPTKKTSAPTVTTPIKTVPRKAAAAKSAATARKRASSTR